VLYKIGEFQRANRAFEKAIELNSSNAVYWHNKGMVLSSMEKYDQSIEAYDRAIEINPQYTDAWVKKATILYMQGNFEEALKAIDNINDLDPKNKIACKIKCNIFRRDSRRYNESIQECNCA
jgi:superkiller protein 3